MSISKATDVNLPIFLDDKRPEETFMEVFAYVFGLGLVEGAAVLEMRTKFISQVVALPLYLMFNKNTLNLLETEIVSHGPIRDFVLNLFTKYSTIMTLRDKNFSVNHLVSVIKNSSISEMELGKYGDMNKQLLKNLTDGVIPEAGLVDNYLTKNRWYIIVVLINVFSINILKVMDEIKRPPVKPEGT